MGQPNKKKVVENNLTYPLINSHGTYEVGANMSPILNDFLKKMRFTEINWFTHPTQLVSDRARIWTKCVWTCNPVFTSINYWHMPKVSLKQAAEWASCAQLQESDAVWTKISRWTRPNGEVFPACGSTSTSHPCSLAKAVTALSIFRRFSALCTLLPEEAGAEAETLPDWDTSTFLLEVVLIEVCGEFLPRVDVQIVNQLWVWIQSFPHPGDRSRVSVPWEPSLWWMRGDDEPTGTSSLMLYVYMASPLCDFPGVGQGSSSH